jgi:hypothetical protein
MSRTKKAAKAFHSIRPEVLIDLTPQRGKGGKHSVVVFTKPEVKARYRARNRKELNAKNREYKRKKRAELKSKQITPPYQYRIQFTFKRSRAGKRGREREENYLAARSDTRKQKYWSDPIYRAKCIARTAARNSLPQAMEKNRLNRRIYNKKKCLVDPLFALKRALRRRIWMAFRNMGFGKKSSCLILLGASFEEVRSHVESTFQPGMNWSNYGLHGWHLDHVIPLASAKNEAELISLFHYKNIQALWAIDNLSKGAKYGS